MDDSHISMIDFKLPMDFFDQYAEDYRGAIALNLEETLKVLGKLGKNDELTVSRDEATAKLDIKLRGHKSLTRYKSIPTLELVEEEAPQPKIFFKSKTRLLTDPLKFALEDLGKVSQHVTFTSDDSVFELSAIGDLGTDKTPFLKGSDNVIDHRVEENSKTTYTIEYLVNMFKAFIKVCDAVTIEYSNEMPCRIEAELPKGTLIYYLAPCYGT
jgi:DNA polymerase III sliding clamp (beta) subunit (PCNA family)